MGRAASGSTLIAIIVVHYFFQFSDARDYPLLFTETEVKREGVGRSQCEILDWPYPQERNPTEAEGWHDMLSERGRIPLGNFDVNKKPTYGSVIIGTESRDISREIYVTLARSFLVLVVDHPPFVREDKSVCTVVSLETLLSNTMAESRIEFQGMKKEKWNNLLLFENRVAIEDVRMEESG